MTILLVTSFYDLNYGKKVTGICDVGSFHCKNPNGLCECWCHSNSKQIRIMELKERIRQQKIEKYDIAIDEVRKKIVRLTKARQDLWKKQQVLRAGKYD